MPSYSLAITNDTVSMKNLVSNKEVIKKLGEIPLPIYRNIVERVIGGSKVGKCLCISTVVDLENGSELNLWFLYSM